MNGSIFYQTIQNLRDKVAAYDKKIVTIAKQNPYAPGLKERLENLCQIRDAYLKVLAGYENLDIDYPPQPRSTQCENVKI